MLTRRGLVGCALCALAGFTASDAGAQQGTQTAGLKRTLIGRLDGPAPGYETIEAKVETDPGAVVAKHTHFGIENAYIISGALTLEIEGQPTHTYNAGEGYQVPTGLVHGGKTGDQPLVLSVVYVVEKGKPLATPA